MISFSRYYFYNYVMKKAIILHWGELSKHPHITPDIVIENLKLPWDPLYLSINPNITIECYLQHFGKELIPSLYKNPTVSLDRAISLENELESIEMYLMNPSLVLEEAMERLPDIFTKYTVFFLDENITFNPNTLLLFPDYHWNWKDISKSKYITFDFVLEHQDLPWNYTSLSKNPNLTIDIVNENTHIPWNIEGLCSNEHVVDWNCFYDNPEFPWNMRGLCSNYNFKSIDIEKLFPPGITITDWLLKYRMNNDNFTFEEACAISINTSWISRCMSKKVFRGEQENFYNNVNNSMTRCHGIKNELIENVFHPRRLESLLNKYDSNYILDYWTDV